MKPNVRINLKGLDALKKALVINRKVVRVGVLGNSAIREGGLTNATLAAIQHGGSESRNIPPRPFLKMPIEHNKQELITQSAKILKSGGIENINIALSQVGKVCESFVQEAFDTAGYGTWKPNAPTTIKRKGSAQPLIDEAKLRRSITSDVKTYKK